MPTTPPYCDTCRHFVRLVHDTGECHRHAPRPVVEAAATIRSTGPHFSVPSGRSSAWRISAPSTR